ncbi:TetR/AcrR family transcriptional regulator [Paenibacillus sp. N4]|uniref:TetR/AcrR family transcriptional regulator n=1 Tax=Paenibacillus vietnamensis TaxID=2590547 RepID=UPI001CD12F9D|nr:TetR/AcrR family transcriptional regulator [Paenibacillus vietnamensis]MCA0756855.1 TetR/AcrR family transcriptional regulator [Paenibacillus vietnamensis]
MDKKTLILQHAMDLFAEKGYHQTTIQDIADAAGIAKGGIYFYFKSKEDLVLAGFAQYHDRLFKSVSDAAARYAFDPKEALVQQIMVQFNELASHYGLLSLFWRGRVDVSDEIRQLSMKMRTKFFMWFRNQIISLYGPGIEPHAFDLSALTTALIREYMGFILLNGVQPPVREVAEFIVSRLDNSIQGILSAKEPPVLTNALMRSIIPEMDVPEGVSAASRLAAGADAVLGRLEEWPLPEEDRIKAKQAAEALKEEAGQPKPRRIVAEGLVMVLQSAAGKALPPECPEMEQLKLILNELEA